MANRESQVRTLKLSNLTLDDLQRHTQAAWPRAASLRPNDPGSPDHCAPTVDAWLFESGGRWTLHCTEHDAGLLWAIGEQAGDALAITGESFHGRTPYYAFTRFDPAGAKTWWVDPHRALDDSAPIRAVMSEFLGTDDLESFLSEELKAWPGTYVGRLKIVEKGVALPAPAWDITNRPTLTKKVAQALETPVPAPVAKAVDLVTLLFVWAWIAPLPIAAGLLLYGLSKPSNLGEVWPASLFASLFVSWLVIVPLRFRGGIIPWPLRLLVLVVLAAVTPFIAWGLR